ncbi:hypothetical protein ACET3Z_024298 [Daucus carota]
MADTAKLYSPRNELKSLFYFSRTKKSVFLTYVFTFSFILFTLFLAFNPNPANSYSSSTIWFKNIFNGLTASYQNVSTFSANTSQILVHNSTVLEQEPLIVKTQNLNFELDGKVGKFTQNVTIEPSEVKNGTQNEGLLHKPGIFKPNITTIEVPQSEEEVKNQTLKKGLVDRAAISEQSSGELNKNVGSAEELTGHGDERTEEKGVVTNLSTSLLKKETKEVLSGDSERSKTNKMMEELMNCDLFDGEWVRDDSYPLYKPGSCSLIDEQFNCFRNGRPDQEYQQYKWKPKGCTLPRLDGRNMLELLRGKRLVFVGDSLNRNMWESLICILKNFVKDPSKVYEASGKRQFRSDPHFSFVFKDYDFTVEFFVSPFLVQEWQLREKNGSTHETLRIDRMWIPAVRYKTADIIIFNTGHWWTHPKTSQGKDYYQEGTRVHRELNVMEAFRKALTTWSRWVDANVNPDKSLVFFRGYSASHFSGGQWNSGGQCDNESEPIKNDQYLTEYPPMMKVLEQVLQKMKTPVSYLNITRLTDYRKDGHPSVYRKQQMSSKNNRQNLAIQDCSHWCLPGVPDLWNELLYAELLVKQYQKQQRKTP